MKKTRVWPALLAALAAMDQQMNCEEQQGKEHPV